MKTTKQFENGCSSQTKRATKKYKIDQDLEFISICVKSSQYIIIHNLSKKTRIWRIIFSVQ